MSAAADEPARAPARLSVVSTIGYTAFLTGPPVLGFIGDEVGALHALLLISLLLVPAAALVPAARKPVSPDPLPSRASSDVVAGKAEEGGGPGLAVDRRQRRPGAADGGA